MSVPVSPSQDVWSWWNPISAAKAVGDTVTTTTQDVFSSISSWWSAPPEKNERSAEEKPPKRVQGWNVRDNVLKANSIIRAAGTVSKTSKKILGVVEEEVTPGRVAGVLAGVTAVASVASLHEGVQRMRTLREGREITDSMLTAGLDTARIVGGMATAVHIADEFVEFIPVMEMGEPLFMVSGLLNFLGPVRLAFRWKDTANWNHTLDARMAEIERLARGPNPHLAEAEIRSLLLVFLYELLQQDDYFLNRQFKMGEADRERLAEVAQAVLLDDPEAVVSGAAVVRDLRKRVTTRLKDHQVEAASTTASLAGFSLLVLTPASLAAQALMGMGAAISLGKLAYDHLPFGKGEEKPLPPEEMEMEEKPCAEVTVEGFAFVDVEEDVVEG